MIVCQRFGQRVTRLGEFSPIGSSLTLDRALKIAEVAQLFGYYFQGTINVHMY
jgi:hypothetical protein